MAPATDVVLDVSSEATAAQKQVRLRIAQLGSGQMKGIFAIYAVGCLMALALTIASVIVLDKKVILHPLASGPSYRR
jgi:hypothetical protein